MEIGFIGAGKMAGILMEKVDAVDDASITAVCDVDEDAAREAADPRDATAYTDHETLYAEEPLDAVFVAILRSRTTTKCSWPPRTGSTPSSRNRSR